MFLDSQATKKNVTEALDNLIKNSKPGDILVLTNSSHGTSVLDTSGDEPDRKDEAICLYDSFWIDDEIRVSLAKLDPQVSFTFISDSCFSGTVTRDFIRVMTAAFPGANPDIRPRYLPPKDNDMAHELKIISHGKKVFVPVETMKEVLLAGCSDNEYSYDASFATPMGAFSHYAIEVLRTNPQVTYQQFDTALREYLPSGQYPQTPQVEGSPDNLNKIVFT